MFEKITFKASGGYKDEKNSYLSSAYTNLAVRRLKYTCTNPAKFIKLVDKSVNFEKCTFEKIGEFMTKFDPILGPPIGKGTLKICRKITKITHPNSDFFLGDGANNTMKFPQNF